MDDLKIIAHLNNIPNLNGWEKLKKLKKIQLKFLADAINDRSNIYEKFERAIAEIFECISLKMLSNSNIVIKNGLVVISNHLGINKLTKIYPEDFQQLCDNVELPIPSLENDDPFVLLLAPIVATLSKSVKDWSKYEVIFVFMKLPLIYDEILKSLNAVTIKRNSSNQYSDLKQQVAIKVKDARTNNKKPIIIIFPEGGTSGKHNSKGPYSLLEFKDGYKSLARDFDLDILPIAVSIDSDINFYANVGQYLPFLSSGNEDRKALIKLLSAVNAE